MSLLSKQRFITNKNNEKGNTKTTLTNSGYLPVRLRFNLNNINNNIDTIFVLSAIEFVQKHKWINYMRTSMFLLKIGVLPPIKIGTRIFLGTLRGKADQAWD